MFSNKNRTIQVRLVNSDYLDVARAARENHQTISAYVRQVLREATQATKERRQ